MEGSNRATSDNDLGRAIRKRRAELGLSQERLAALANVSRATIQNLEAGRVERAYRLPDVADALGVSVLALTGDPEHDDAASSEEVIGNLPPMKFTHPEDQAVWDSLSDSGRRSILRIAREAEEQQRRTG